MIYLEKEDIKNRKNFETEDMRTFISLKWANYIQRGHWNMNDSCFSFFSFLPHLHLSYLILFILFILFIFLKEMYCTFLLLYFRWNFFIMWNTWIWRKKIDLIIENRSLGNDKRIFKLLNEKHYKCNWQSRMIPFAKQQISFVHLIRI